MNWEKILEDAQRDAQLEREARLEEVAKTLLRRMSIKELEILSEMDSVLSDWLASVERIYHKFITGEEK